MKIKIKDSVKIKLMKICCEMWNGSGSCHMVSFDTTANSIGNATTIKMKFIPNIFQTKNWIATENKLFRVYYNWLSIWIMYIAIAYSPSFCSDIGVGLRLLVQHYTSIPYTRWNSYVLSPLPGAETDTCSYQVSVFIRLLVPVPIHWENSCVSDCWDDILVWK